MSRAISKNGYKVWLLCKNCGKCFLVVPSKQYFKQYCSRSCRAKFQVRDGNCKIVKEKISKNDFKVWLQCKYCDEYFLVLPTYQYRRQCCSKSCARKFDLQDEKRRKFQSDLLKRRRVDLNSDFNQNQAKAARESIIKRNKTPEMRNARYQYLMSNLGKNGFYISPHQRELYNNLTPYLGTDSIELEVVFDMKDTKLQSEFWQRWIRVDLLHKSSGVIVEVDGRSHRRTVEKDKCRDKALKDKGFFVVRVTNDEITKNLREVTLNTLSTIYNKASNRCLLNP